MKVFHKICFRRAPIARDSDWKWLQLRRGAAARRSAPKNSASSGKAHLPGGEHSECVGTPAKPSFTGGNKTPTVRRRTATGSGFSSGEEPLHGGAYQKIAPAPGKPISPEENIQNVGRTPAKPSFTGGNDKWRVLPVAVTAVYNGTERL